MFVLLFMVAMGARAYVPATKADVGKVICSDGSIYATVADATAAGKTAQAMIAYVDDEKGMALGISLEDGPIADIEKGCKHSTAVTVAQAFNTSHPINDATWRLPSVNDWEHMFIGCGSTSEYVASLPNPQWTSGAYSTAYQFYPGNIREMVVAAGGTDFTVDPYKYYGYWSNTGSATTGGMWWAYYFDFGPVSSGPQLGFSLEVSGLVRPCVEFEVPISPEYFTLTLNTTKTIVPLNKTMTLTATLTPANDYNKNVVWTTDNANVQLFSDAECTKVVNDSPTEILTVYVKGITEGTATVTVTSSVDAAKTASCEMTVKQVYAVTMKEGTPDADLWTVTYIADGDGVILGYSGKKKVKGVTLVTSGREGTFIGNNRWSFTLPQYDEVAEVEYYPTLVDSEDNSVAIDALNGTTQEVLCLNTLLPLGWTIFSAPFDIPASVLMNRCAIGEVREFVGSSFVKGGDADDAAMPSTIKLYFDQVTEMKAGVPYLVRVNMERDLYTYTFSNVTVNNVYTTVDSKYASFIPTNSQTLVTDDPQNVLFTSGGGYINKEYPYNGVYYHPTAYHPEAPIQVKGFSGYFWLTPEVEKVFPDGGSRFEIVFGPYEPEAVEPITEETTEKPSDIAKEGEVTTSESGITYALSSTFGSVDEEDGSITITASMTTDAMKAILEENAPGSSAFVSTFTGFYFLMSAGKGKVEIEIETLGDDVALAIMQGLNISGEYTMSEKGTLTIQYDVTKDTWFFAFPIVKASSEAPAHRAPVDTSAVKIYSIKVIPDDGTGIEYVGAGETGTGYIYNLQGQRVTSLTKGLYIVDGKKVVMK